MPEAPANGEDNDSYEEDQYGDTYDLDIGADYKNTFFINSENKSFPNGWISVNELQPNKYVIGRYQYPQLNSNTVRVGAKMLIHLAHW